MLRPRLRIPLRPRLDLPTQASSVLMPLAAQRTRSHHTVPSLEQFNRQNGIPGFLSPQALAIAWDAYQTHVLQRLNALTAESDFETKDLQKIVLATSREPRYASIFNYASMAHNNHFFFKNLVGSEETIHIPKQLESDLCLSFGSIETLKLELIKTASAMFGPGFVWLVKTEAPGAPNLFKVLPTYLAGSPYPGAHWRRQDVDANTDIGSSTPEGLAAGKRFLEDSAYGAGNASAAVNSRHKFAPGGTDLTPVLCLNTWEHVWLFDYQFGVGSKGGKYEYAMNWWKKIDWDKVSQLAYASPKAKMLG
ncbi:Manganese/iron superoxide dismutase [Podospora fimiseda]|uniref:Manganese/iron superoxide dismutase n=1 Tax=Podospora fimiseda TaxID=252190 RepID=A0AAN7BMI6_9PEZI|nr:Manganese/iron superoxide dismutase [Podospora fimiseda]